MTPQTVHGFGESAPASNSTRDFGWSSETALPPAVLHPGRRSMHADYSDDFDCAVTGGGCQSNETIGGEETTDGDSFVRAGRRGLA
eukprot:4203933-Pyramimonas_sp.AAC.1